MPTYVIKVLTKHFKMFHITQAIYSHFPVPLYHCGKQKVSMNSNSTNYLSLKYSNNLVPYTIKIIKRSCNLHHNYKTHLSLSLIS